MWCVARFGISHYLAFAWTLEGIQMHANGSFYQRVNTSNLKTFKCCCLISNIMRIAMQCHPSQYYVMYLRTLLFAVQFNVSISFLWLLFVYYLFLVIQQITNTVILLKFQYNVQFSSAIFKKKNVPRSLQLKNIVSFKNKNM